jgi:hypothetical protein
VGLLEQKETTEGFVVCTFPPYPAAKGCRLATSGRNRPVTFLEIHHHTSLSRRRSSSRTSSR